MKKLIYLAVLFALLQSCSKEVSKPTIELRPPTNRPTVYNDTLTIRVSKLPYVWNGFTYQGWVFHLEVKNKVKEKTTFIYSFEDSEGGGRFDGLQTPMQQNERQAGHQTMITPIKPNSKLIKFKLERVEGSKLNYYLKYVE